MTTGTTLSNAFSIPAGARDASAFFWRRRPLFWAALAWMSGIVFDDALAPGGVAAGLAAALLGVAGLVGIVALRKSRQMQVALALTAFACGLATHAFLARILPADHIANLTTEHENKIRIEGVIVQCTHTQRGSARWVLECERVWKNDSTEPAMTEGRVQLFVNNAPADAMEGSRVRLYANLSQPRHTFPDDFDLTTYLARNGIFRTGQALAKQPIETDLPQSWNPLLRMRRLSYAFSARMEAQLPALQLEGRTPESEAALLNALLFGRREHLDRADRDAFVATGTAHLLAISGLQIQFMAWLLWGVLRACGISRRTNAIILFFATWAYTALSGAEPPIVRAAVMISLALIGQLAWRETDPLSLLGAAAIAILAFDPEQVFQAGFQLSFVAVFALLTLVPLLNDALKPADDPLAALKIQPVPGFWMEFRSLVLVSFAAWLGTAPIIAWHMKQFSILCVPTNLISVPLSSLAMVCGLLALGVGIISSTLAAPFAWAAYAVLALLQTFTDLAASAPLSALRVDPPHVAVIVLYAAAANGLWMLRSSKHVRIHAATTCVLMVGSMFAGVRMSRATTDASVTLLNVGRGRAVLLQHGDDGILIDAGAPSSGARLAALLELRGIRRLKAVIALENEYGSLGGIPEIVQRVHVDRVVLPRAATLDGLRRNVEATLRTKKIPFTDSPSGFTRDALSGFEIELADDSAIDATTRQSETALAVRVTSASSTLLIQPTRSAASLERFEKGNPPAFFTAQTIALTGHYSGHWPRNTESLLDRSGAKRVISLASETHDPPQFRTKRIAHELEAGSLLLQPNGIDWRVQIFDGRWHNAE